MATKDGRKTGGRKKGTPNKLTQRAAQRLEELGCDPLELSVRVAMGKDLDGPHPSVGEFRRLVHDLQNALDGKGEDPHLFPDRLQALIDENLLSGYVPMEIRSRHIIELIQYKFPKLKAVEMTGPGGTDLIPSFDPSTLSDAALRELVGAIVTKPAE